MPTEFDCGFNFSNREQSGYFGIHVVLYESAEQIVLAFSDGAASMRVEEVDGVSEYTQEGLVAQVKSLGAWGWTVPIDKEKVVHLWVDKYADLETLRTEIVATIAHECGHLNGPHYQNIKTEEKKAVQYEYTAQLATDAADTVIYALKYRGLSKMSNAELAGLIRDYSDIVINNVAANKPSTVGTEKLMAFIREARRRGI